MKGRLPALAASLALGTVLLLLLARPGAEERIRNEWTSLLDECGHRLEEGLLADAQAARGVQRHFTTDAVIQTGEPHPMHLSRQDVPGVLLRAWRELVWMRVTDQGHTIEIAPGRTSAVMRATVTLAAQAGDSVGEWTDEYRVEWTRTPDGWMIARIEPTPLTAPAP